MRPAAHQAAALIGKMRQLDLQASFSRQGALAENLQNETGAIEHLRTPGLLQIALLDRAYGMIDDDKLGAGFVDALGDLLNFAGAQKRRRARAHEWDDLGHAHIKADGPRQADGLGETVLARTIGARARVAVAVRTARCRPARVAAPRRAYGQKHKRTRLLRAPINRLTTLGAREFLRRWRCRTRYA